MPEQFPNPYDTSQLEVQDYSAAWWNQDIVGVHNKPIGETSTILDTPEQVVNAEKALTEGEGWKLHLNINPEDSRALKAVSEMMAEFTEAKGTDILYKIGGGGGIDAKAPGKEATIYAGSIDLAAELADAIEAELEDFLLPQVGVLDSDVLKEDLPFSDTGKVWGRFCVEKSQPRDIQDDSFVGSLNGIPMYSQQFAHTTNSGESWGGTEPYSIQKNVNGLTDLYGSFFSSDANSYQELLERRDNIMATKE